MKETCFQILGVNVHWWENSIISPSQDQMSHLQLVWLVSSLKPQESCDVDCLIPEESSKLSILF